MLTTSRWKELLLAASGSQAGDGKSEEQRFQYLAMRVGQNVDDPDRVRRLILNHLCEISAPERPPVLDRLEKEISEPVVLGIVAEIRQRISR
jgi:hypothetical protein